jgi:hypothetical protein
MTKNKVDYVEFIENHTVKNDVSSRGGTLKVDTSELFPYIDDCFVCAYQNYLGGGMLGAVVGVSTFLPSRLNKKDLQVYEDIKDTCKEYVFNCSNHEGDEWEEQSYIQNQNMPVSAY